LTFLVNKREGGGDVSAGYVFKVGIFMCDLTK